MLFLLRKRVLPFFELFASLSTIPLTVNETLINQNSIKYFGHQKITGRRSDGGR